MKKVKFSIDINAEKSRIWKVLWDDTSYPKWTSAFFEGSYAESDNWKEGTIAMFLAPGKNGMFSLIKKHVPNQIMSFKHLGMVTEGVQQAEDKTASWYGYEETYELSDGNDGVILTATLDTDETSKESIGDSFHKALEIVKILSEGKIRLNTNHHTTLEKRNDGTIIKEIQEGTSKNFYQKIRNEILSKGVDHCRQGRFLV